MAQVLCKVFSFVLVILLGVVTARSGKLGKGADRLISKIVFNLTLPCAIIRAFESYDFNVSLLGLVGLGFAATVIPYFLSLFVYRNKPQQERIVQQLSVCGFNIGCFALAFVQAFFPAGCVVATCLFDAGNSLMGTGGTYALTQTLVLGDDDQSRGQKLKTFCKTLFSSVAFDSYIVLIAMGLLGLKIPAEVITLIDPIANANAFLAMFMVGLMIRFSLTGKKVKELSDFCPGALFLQLFCLLLRSRCFRLTPRSARSSAFLPGRPSDPPVRSTRCGREATSASRAWQTPSPSWRASR